jgi:hypothetical protein
MNLAIAIAIVLAIDAIAVTAMLLVRRRAPEGSFFTDGDRASGVFGVLATGFAIFAGFVLFLSFTTYDQSRAGAEEEALVVAQQFETAQLLPATTRDRLAGELVCYARSVVEQEWPRMEDGEIGNSLNPWGVRLFETIRDAEATTFRQQTAYAKWLDQTSDREAARQDRIHGASGITPLTVWLVLLISAVIVFAYMLFFADPAEMKRSQAMLVGSATTIVVVTLLVIFALDNPYRPGLASIQPTAMERTQEILVAARAAVSDESPIPCDGAGNAAR